MLLIDNLFTEKKKINTVKKLEKKYNKCLPLYITEK